MCKNKQELELEPCYEKRELGGDILMKTKNSGAAAGDMFMKRKSSESREVSF